MFEPACERRPLPPGTDEEDACVRAQDLADGNRSGEALMDQGLLDRSRRRPAGKEELKVFPPADGELQGIQPE